AVARAGAAWLPLDPAAPAARRAFILSDAAPALILSDLAHASRLPSGLVDLILVDDFAAAPDCALPGVTPDDAAYLVYTSGTTGQPKGVLVPHRAVANHAAHHVAMCVLRPDDRVLNFAATGFDTCVEEIVPSLIAGATIVARPEGFLDTGRDFDAFLARNRITVADLPTQFWHQWTTESGGMPGYLRLVILGGEALTAGQVADWHRRADTAAIRLINTYGPTEATIIATAADVADVGPDGAGSAPPLGEAIGGACVRLLDDALAPVPPGVPGEIFLGGDCLATGYLNRPGLTAERFLPDPFGPPGARLYRTGDIGRLRADGSLQFLGRADDQIKLRGFRIEPAEVEAALRHAGAVSAHACVREDAPGDRRLVAYVTAPIAEEELVAALPGLLPGPMIPQHVVVLDRLPMTVNGKVDRRALPAPERRQKVQAPLGPTAQALADIWGAVLNLSPDEMADDDNFFALGGHSLLATRVISRIRTGFAIDLPLRALFEHPTIGALAPVIDGIAAASAPEETDAILPLPRDGALPLSFAQQRLWFLDQFEPENPYYNIPIALRLEGALDVAALHRALDAIVARHEVLRSRIRPREHMPEVVIDPPAPLDLPVDDLAPLDPAARDRAAAAILAGAARQPFDLARTPMLRARLLRLGPDSHILAVVLHHIVADGWSMGVLVRELAALYAAFRNGAESPLAPLPVQYADFAAWQRAWLRGPRMQRQLDYWTARLADAPAVLDLPTDRPRPAIQSYRGATVGLSLDATLAAALRDRAQAGGVTLFMLLHTAFAVLMHRISGQEDILIGTPVAGRNRSDIEGLVGFFVNTLVLRSRIDRDMGFDTLLERSRDGTLAAFDHQDVPFEHLVETLAPERHLGHAPLFQVMFVLQNAPVDPVALEGLSLSEMPMPSTGAKFDLTCMLHETGTGLEGHLEYATDLFDAATARRLAAQFRCLLEDIARRPAAPVGALRLVDEGTERRLVGDWAAGPFAPPAEDVIARFEATAAGAPHAAAVCLGETVWDYGRLDARADALAAVLMARGAGPETVVGIAAAPTPAMIAGLIAILKTGAAYLPLDPALPPKRIAFMLEDAAPAMVLTDAASRPAFASAGLPLVDLDEPPGSAPPPDRRMAPPPAAAGYVMYTSGSTGRPKGVVLPRGTLNNLVRWQIDSAPVPDAVLQFASFSFDVSFQEVFSTLCAGRRLVLVPEGLKQDLSALRDHAAAQGVGRMFLPNAVLQQWLLLPAPAAPVPPCEIVSAGEALVTADRAALQGALGGATLFNQYGPTETHVVTQMALPAASASEGEARPPIGRPIPNVRTYVLDAGLRPVAPGIWGQLFIGGEAPARGYHNRPDLTAAAFLPDPFAGGGARMYATGDIARWREDGTLEYRGRIDDQVKVLGIRVEPGEVAAALHELPQVADAAVVLREDQPGAPRLVAYVVLHDPADGTDLRGLLAARLPSYMVPASLVVLERLPLTANGKLDRRGLPVPVAEARGARPGGGVAGRVAGIWAEVLGLSPDAIGMEDTFFALGGHSLLATQVISRLRAAFGIELPLRALFEHPTLAALAPAIEAAMAAGGAAEDGPKPRAGTGPAPLSFAQQRLWFLDQLAPGDTAYSLPMALRLDGALDARALAAALG
ncbi:non-ribosomal peptide synthetase, partial [Oceaniglobus roseus]|uniref:non-ribosomal peptide synthetase n=1 Tax=Oceaniglobus roseus TaxID=1737570 RepID=UPI0012FFFC7F